MKPTPWPEFLRQVEELYQPPMRAARTCSKMLSVLRAVGELGVRTTADLNVSIIARYVTARSSTVCPRTVHTDLLYLQSAAGLAVSLGLLDLNPFAVRRPGKWIRPGRAAEHKHFTREQIAAVLATLEADIRDREGWALWRARRLQCVVAIFAFCGLRRDECLYLHVEDVDMERRIIWIRSRRENRLKTADSEDLVPIPKALMPILASWLEHRLDRPPGTAVPESPWLFPTIRGCAPWVSGEPGKKPLHRLQAIAARSGSPGMTFASLRHSIATHAEFWGMGPAMVQRLLRHSNADTQAHYRHSDLPNMLERADQIEY